MLNTEQQQSERVSNEGGAEIKAMKGATGASVTPAQGGVAERLAERENKKG